MTGQRGRWHLVGSGLSTVVAGDGEIVCRVPLNHEAMLAQERLRALLPLLAPHLPAPIPAPLRRIPAAEGLPFGALVLRRLSGRPLPDSCVSATVAKALATFLATLHSLPASLVPPALLVHHDGAAADRDIRETALPAFMAAFPSEASAAVAWWDVGRSEYSPVIVHDDFWHENILVASASGEVTGIMDWENCGVGDPAMDLAPLWHANPFLFHAVLDSYARFTGDDPAALRQRARWQFGRREWAGLAWAVRLGQTDDLPDALSKVRAVLAGAADGM